MCWSCRTTSARRKSGSSSEVRSCTRHSSASASGHRPGSSSPARRPAWSGTRRPERVGRPDHRAERIRPGAEPDRGPAGGRVRRVRQRWAAGHASRRRGLDRCGRRSHAAEQPPAERIIREETAARCSSCSPRDRQGHRTGRPGPRLHGRRQDGHGPGRRPVKVEGPDGELVERWQYHDGWVDSSFVGILPAGDTKLVTLVLLHRPAVWGLSHGRAPRDRVRRPHAPGARLPRHSAGSAAGRGCPAMMTIDSTEAAAGCGAAIDRSRTCSPPSVAGSGDRSESRPRSAARRSTRDA